LPCLTLHRENLRHSKLAERFSIDDYEAPLNHVR
jgi:hypothetical protein